MVRIQKHHMMTGIIILKMQFANPKVEFILHNTTPNTLPFNKTAMETLIKIFVETVQNMEQQESKLI